MTLGHRPDKLWLRLIQAKPLLEFRKRSSGSGQISLVDYDHVSRFEHHNFL